MKKTEEKGIIVVHEVKCKLYVKVFVCVNSVLSLEAAQVNSLFMSQIFVYNLAKP